MKSLLNFVRTLPFTTAKKDLEDLEYQLESYFIPNHTDKSGWDRLKNEIPKWATQKKTPKPDGKIKLHHVKNLLTSVRPETIRQNFIVPENYHPPDTDFHNKILDRIKSKKTTVIWGTPGIGKSTYISYLFDCLKKQKICCYPPSFLF